jgi:hypothetical protein
MRRVVPSTLRGVARTVIGAASYSLGPGGVSIAAPQLVFTTAYLLVYGLGLATVGLEHLRRPELVILAVVLGAVGVVLGAILGWARFGEAHGYPRGSLAPGLIHSGRAAALGTVLCGIGLVSLALYFSRIGGLPIFMSNAEEARVEAATRGGAVLRATGLLALPGAWLLVAHAAASRRRSWAALAAVVLVVVGLLWLGTANRAPAFLLWEVAVLGALYVGGKDRLGVRALALLIPLVLGAVLLAGFIGAVRLSSAPGSQDAGGQATETVDVARLAALTKTAIEGYVRVPIQNFEYTMDAVPDRIPWRLGYTYLQPILTALPGRQTTFDLDLKAALGQDFAGGGTVPGLLGESYANFGPPGWFFVPAALAFSLQWAFWVARRLNTSVAWLFYAYLVALATGALVGGLSVASPFPFIAVALLGTATLWSRTWPRIVASS